MSIIYTICMKHKCSFTFMTIRQQSMITWFQNGRLVGLCPTDWRKNHVFFWRVLTPDLIACVVDSVISDEVVVGSRVLFTSNSPFSLSWSVSGINCKYTSIFMIVIHYIYIKQIISETKQDFHTVEIVPCSQNNKSDLTTKEPCTLPTLILKLYVLHELLPFKGPHSFNENNIYVFLQSRLRIFYLV